MQAVLIIGAVQALFFAILLFNKKGKQLPDKILAIWLIIFAVHLSYIYFLSQNGYNTYLKYGGYDIGLIVLYYSLMYLYAKTLISNDSYFKPNWLLHLIPTVIAYIGMIPYMLLSFEEKKSLVESSISKNIVINLSVIVILLFIGFYLVIIFRLLNKHGSNIKRLFSFEEDINLAWLKRLSIILAAIWIAFVGISFYIYYKDYTLSSGTAEFYINIEFYGYCLFVGFIYLLGYFGYKQGNIFSFQKSYNPKSNISDNNKIESHVNEKITRVSSETESEEKIFVDKFNKYMIEQKPYLDSTLSLFQLAKELDISTHYLSHILNNHIHKNFYELINHYRVDEVKRRIISNGNSNFTLLAIALDCGFNSKATFNRIFKNYTGFTPSQFQKEYS